MLLEVEIRNLAIVDSARVEFGPGLCVLSGETGAGKSIVIDAIAALLGERTGIDVVRAGAESATLRAVFDVADAPTARSLLEEFGYGGEDLCIITRELRAGGRGRCAINGGTATVAMLRRLGEALIDIHGQHEHQSLLRVGEHLRILDGTGGEPLREARRAYQMAYEAWRATREAIERLRLDEGEKARRADMLRFQVDEIGNARLAPGEDEALRAERDRLVHAERLVERASRAYAALAEGDEAPSAAERVGQALAALQEMAAHDAELRPLAEELEGACHTIAEAARTLAGYADRLDADPRRLDAIEGRLETIERLTRKYGGSIEAVIEFGQRAAEELDAIATADERLAELTERLAGESAALARAAETLSGLRAQAAEALGVAVARHLRDLGMSAAQVRVELRPHQADDGIEVAGRRLAPGPDGTETAELMFTANPGEPLRPLAKIASGGELSRVMLALKSQTAQSDAPPTMVFDEIDVGIGGVTVHSVGRKMATIAADRQVICVTHHAPIAAMADRHIVIEKEPGEDATVVTVRHVEGEERVYELARMLGRKPPTEATLAMARELLAELGRAP